MKYGGRVPQGVAPAFPPWLRVGLVVSSLRVLDLVSYPWRLESIYTVLGLAPW